MNKGEKGFLLDCIAHTHLSILLFTGMGKQKERQKWENFGQCFSLTFFWITAIHTYDENDCGGKGDWLDSKTFPLWFVTEAARTGSPLQRRKSDPQGLGKKKSYLCRAYVYLLQPRCHYSLSNYLLPVSVHTTIICPCTVDSEYWSHVVKKWDTLKLLLKFEISFTQQF